MNILNFGSCNIDYVYSVTHMVNGGETLSANRMDMYPGGKGLNQSIALARAGARVYHAGCIGNDGEMLLALLRQSGVDTTFCRRLDTKNGHAIIQVDSNGENSIIVYKGTNGMISRAFMDEVLSHFGAGDLLLLQNEINDVAYLVEKASGMGMQILLNPSPFCQELKQLDLNRLSYLIVNETEAAALAGISEPDRFIAWMRSRYPQLAVVLTRGKRGCIYADNQQHFACPAFQVQTVDTTGAGDTFTGYFAARLAAGMSCRDAITTASAASALAVSRAGAAPSIPVLTEVLTALKTLRSNLEGSESKLQFQRGQVCAYVETHLTDACLEELAKQLGYSPMYAGERIRALMGITFSQLLQRTRCEAAARLLRHTDLSVSQIIHQVGYENESFFRKIFRKQYGKTPYQYRKEERI